MRTDSRSNNQHSREVTCTCLIEDFFLRMLLCWAFGSRVIVSTCSAERLRVPSIRNNKNLRKFSRVREYLGGQWCSSYFFFFSFFFLEFSNQFYSLYLSATTTCWQRENCTLKENCTFVETRNRKRNVQIRAFSIVSIVTLFRR